MCKRYSNLVEIAKKNPGAKGKIKKEQGAQKNEKGEMKKVKKEQAAKN